MMATEADRRLQHLKEHGYVVFQLLGLTDARIAKQHIQSTLWAVSRLCKCVCNMSVKQLLWHNKFTSE